jgi:hypothetical protein
MSGCRRRTAPPVSREHVGAGLAGPTPAGPDATGLSGDAINEKSRTDCKGFFHYCCHIRHSEVTEKVKIFGGCALITEKFRRAGGTYRQAAFDPTQKFPDGTNRAFACASA